MNVALFASAFYPSLGGVEELVRQLAHALRHGGNETIVVTQRWPRNLPTAEVYEGLPLFRYPMRVPDGCLKAHVSYRLTHARIRAGVSATLREHRVDLAHVQCVSATTHYALAARQYLKLPLVVSLQGELTMDATHLYQRSAFARSVMRAALTQADAITACSGQTLAEAEAFLGRSFEVPSRVIYNGIRLADFEDVRAYQHPKPYILGIGRHVPQKGFDVLLRAFAEVVRSGSEDYDLLLAGDGEEHGRLQELAAALQLGDRVRFVGRVARTEAVALFLGCSFFVLPSRHEPMGIVNLEAMAAGKPVIASHVGGVPELVVDGRNGLLIPAEDASALAATMRGLMADPTLRSRLGQAGREWAERFDWSVISAQYSAVYMDALDTKRGRTSA